MAPRKQTEAVPQDNPQEVEPSEKSVVDELHASRGFTIVTF